MNEPKAFASLSSGLLARKGAAKPAMRPQGFGQMGASLEDLGWNDMGFEAPKPTTGTHDRDADHDAFGETVAEQPVRNPVAALTPSPVHGQQAEIAERFAAQDDEEDEVAEAEAEDEVDDQIEEEAAPVVEALPQKIFEAEAARVEDQPESFVEAREPRVADQAEALFVEAPPAAVEVQPEALVEAPAPVRSRPAAPRAQAGSGAKAAFTLRLDSARHLRLRLACALTGRSAQMLVTDAVDKLLAEYPELEKFAGQLPESGQSRRVRG